MNEITFPCQLISSNGGFLVGAAALLVGQSFFEDPPHDLVRMGFVMVPSFLPAVGVIVLLGLSIGQMEAGLISDLFACYAGLLAVVLQHFPVTRDHAGDLFCCEL